MSLSICRVVLRRKNEEIRIKKSNKMIEHDRNVLYEGHQIKLEQADHQDISMSILNYKAF